MAIGTIHPFSLESAPELSPGVLATPIAGLFYLPEKKFSDERGYYSELARFPELSPVLSEPFVPKQLNLSYSKNNVIRGIHAENWQKVLTVLSGTIFGAWVDLRFGSATFGEVVTAELSETGALQGSFFVSAGIGNSFYVTQGPAYYLYAVNQLYAERDKSGDAALSVFDLTLHIPWPLLPDQKPIISTRDQQSISFAQFQEQHV